jgi:hypothetical protein
VGQRSLWFTFAGAVRTISNRDNYSCHRREISCCADVKPRQRPHRGMGIPHPKSNKNTCSHFVCSLRSSPFDTELGSDHGRTHSQADKT